MDRPDDLVEIARTIRDAIDKPNVLQQQLLARLEQQARRLRDSALQLAVLGQFKRGKSTLLNALVGYPLLSAGVLPLTAVPTFLSGNSTICIRLSYLSGAVEEHGVADLECLAREIAAATTEEHNSHNEKGLLRVDAGMPGSGWLDDVTLIDTPGIGSTQAHNTETAYAVLPECDAALFVCSVDPPITELEIEYLARICRTAPRVIVILNKIDLVEGDDIQKAIDFLLTVVAGRTPPEVDRRIFPVSARRALAARQAGDVTALEASGLPDLERYVRADLVGERRRVLTLSIANKMHDIAAAIAADAAMTVRALSLPLAELDAKMIAFERTAADFERERIALEDALNGEWRRAVLRLGALCGEVDKRTRGELNSVIDRIGSDDLPDGGRSIVAAAMTEVFDREFGCLATAVDKELAEAIEAHQQHYQALAERVRGAAGALLNVKVPPVAPDDWFQISREPYWVGARQVDSLSALTIEGLARLLPAALRRRRRQRRLREAIFDALIRNISELQWSMRQNIDDSFRRLLAASREAVETGIASTRDLLRMAEDRRRREDLSLDLDLERARRTEQILAELSALLGRQKKAHSQQAQTHPLHPKQFPLSSMHHEDGQSG